MTQSYPSTREVLIALALGLVLAWVSHIGADLVVWLLKGDR